jgi:hypothetical protein
MAAPVCRAWREAAAGCSGIRLLYYANKYTANQSFASWLILNSKQLETFILSSSQATDVNSILGPLAKAATAAAAAGSPLPLHTLRVLGHGPNPQLASCLVRELRNLHTLQWSLQGGPKGMASAGTHCRKHLGSMRHATQLRELYLKGEFPCNYGNPDCTAASGAWLPANLERLSWRGPDNILLRGAPRLQHLTRLSALCLSDWSCTGLSSKLPPGLRELSFGGLWTPLEDLDSQQQVLTGLGLLFATPTKLQALGGFTSVRSIATNRSLVEQVPSVPAYIAQLTALTAFRVAYGMYDLRCDTAQPTSIQAVSTTAASMSTLRHLHLDLEGVCLPLPTGLSGFTQLTRLVLKGMAPRSANAAQRLAWVQAVEQLQGLRWLELQGVLLEAGWEWVDGLQQLRVLVVHDGRWISPGADISRWPWVGACSPRALPPRLLLLGVTCCDARVCLPVRRHLQHLLRGSSCDVVVSPDLAEVLNTTKQLAGLPAALQQALA